MKKRKRLIRQLPTCLYHRDIRILANFSREELIRYLRRTYKVKVFADDFCQGHAGFFQLTPDARGYGQRSFIWLSSFEWTIGDLATLTHEILHAVFKILEDAGVKPCDASDEAYTYYAGWLMAQALRALRPLR
jgi:hypothetical protein